MMSKKKGNKREKLLFLGEESGAVECVLQLEPINRNTFSLSVCLAPEGGVSSKSLETTTKNSDWSSLLYEYCDPIFTIWGKQNTRC